jgi:transcriptional regulator with XRE-family HTH domain
MESLRSLRESKGIQRKFVAEKLKISPDHLSNIERGCTQLKLLQIKSLASVYGIDFSEMAEIALATYERRV